MSRASHTQIFVRKIKITQIIFFTNNGTTFQLVLEILVYWHIFTWRAGFSCGNTRGNVVIYQVAYDQYERDVLNVLKMSVMQTDWNNFNDRS